MLLSSHFGFRILLLLTILIFPLIYYSKVTKHGPFLLTDYWSSRNAHKIDVRKSLEFQNRLRMKYLEGNYSKYLDLKAFHQPLSNKTITWSCSRSKLCSGWGDRLRGMVSVYTLALLTQRRFMIHMKKPCSLSDVLQPNLVNWTFVEPKRMAGTHRTRLTIGLPERDELFDLISKKDFVSAWEPYDDILIVTKSYYVQYALRNPQVNSSWLTKNLPLSFLTQQKLFPLMFEFLFKPTQLVIDAVDEVLRRPYEKLICFHVRIGRNPTNPLDSIFRSRKHLTKQMINFYHQRKDFAQINQSMVFVTSDSDAAVNEILEHFPNRSINIPGPIIHIEYVMKQKAARTDYQTRCSGLVKVIADFLTLGECDVSILTYSGFSQWATRRRLQAHENIFVFNDEKQTFDSVDFRVF